MTWQPLGLRYDNRDEIDFSGLMATKKDNIWTMPNGEVIDPVHYTVPELSETKVGDIKPFAYMDIIST